MAGLNISVRRDKRYTVSKHAVRQFVYAQLVDLWKDCVKAFINEAIKYVHVDTGMSEASFYDLATNVQLEAAVMANIMGKGPKPPHPSYTEISGRVHKGTNKSIALGQELGGRKRAYDLLYGEVRRPVFAFRFNIMIYQYKLHEFGFGGGDAWESLEHGFAAFKACWRSGMRKHITGAKTLRFLQPGGQITRE